MLDNPPACPPTSSQDAIYNVFSASTSQLRSINDAQQENSPYHHPTPNLKAPSKSVAAAKAAAKAADLAKEVPASLTLAKLPQGE